jgi:hypothetical protein
VVHLCRRFGKAAGVQKLPFLGVEFVSHSDVEITGPQ